MSTNKIKSRAKKPPTRMQITLTIEFPETMTHAEEISAFGSLMNAVTGTKLNAAWLHLVGTGMPSEVVSAFAQVAENTQPPIRLVVNNADKE